MRCSRAECKGKRAMGHYTAGNVVRFACHTCWATVLRDRLGVLKMLPWRLR